MGSFVIQVDNDSQNVQGKVTVTIGYFPIDYPSQDHDDKLVLAAYGRP